MNKVFPLLLLALFLPVGCVSKQPQPEGSDAWRLQSLEENFLNFKEKQRASEDRLKKYAQELTARVDHLEELLTAMHMEMQTKLNEMSMNKMIPVHSPETISPQGQVDAAHDAGSGGDSPFTGAAPPASPPIKDSPVPVGVTSDAMYNRGMSLVRAEKYEDGREVLNEFLAQNKTAPLAPNALYWIGESYYGEKRFAQAILTFKEVTQNYPKHHKAAAALLKIGFSYDKLGDAANARFYLQALIDEYPDSEPAKLARQRLKNMD